jgi:hypothetical protein
MCLLRRSPMQPNLLTLQSLLKRVEEADGPDRDLDLDLWLAVVPNPDADRVLVPMLRFTESIDNAVTLLECILPGACGAVEFGGKRQLASIWTRDHVGDPHQGSGRHPALALCAAILRSLLAASPYKDNSNEQA